MSVDDQASPGAVAQVLVSWLRQEAAVYPAVSDRAYSCVQELVLVRGCWFAPAALPLSRERGALQRCFANATHHAGRHKLTYVEGYALTRHGLVVQHAWCSTSDGTAEDPTWPDGEGTAYLGIPFHPTYISQADQRSAAATLLFDQHRVDWRLLREGLPASATVEVGVPVNADHPRNAC